MAPRNSDDDAPWLAEAGDSPRTTVSKRSFFWTLLILLSLAAIIAVGLILLLSKKNGGSTQGYMNAEQAPIITAEPGPYKIPPVDPKGLAVEGQDQTIYAAGEGIDQGSTIDQSAMPESVMPRPGSEPASAPPPGPPRDLMPHNPAPAAAPVPVIVPTPVPATPAAKPVTGHPAPAKTTIPKPDAAAPVPVKPIAAAPVKPAAVMPPKPAATVATKPAADPPKPAPTPAPAPATKKSGTVQLGAFSSEEKANAAWASLAAKHGLAGFSKRVIPIESNGKTLYRLRGSGGDSAGICQKLKAAGDACAVVE